MSALRDLQHAMADALLEGALPPLHALHHGRVDRAAAFAIHDRNVTESLRETLAATFPAVVRLVGAGFFAYAASAFVRRHPPASPCLAEYGRDLPRFLAGFAPCAHLEYLPDCARLEWLLHEAACAPGESPPASYAITRQEAAGGTALRLRLHPALRFLATPWPVDTIVALARSGEARDLAFERQELFLQVRCVDREGRTTRLAAAAFAFRQALACGMTAEDGLDRAVAVDPAFDVAAALAALVAEGAVVGASLERSAEEDR